MFIETAVKNIVLEEVLSFIQSENINDMFTLAVEGFHNSPITLSREQKQKIQQNKLFLQKNDPKHIIRININPEILKLRIFMTIILQMFLYGLCLKL